VIDLATAELPPIINPEYAALMLECEPKTVEDHLRAGTLPGEKFGTGWIIPTGAFLQRVNEVAMINAAERLQQRKSGSPLASVVNVPFGKRVAPQLPELPT
jgi:hypothetical protein